MTVITHLPPAKRVGMHRQEFVGNHTQEIIRRPGFVPRWNEHTPTSPLQEVAVSEKRVSRGLLPNSQVPDMIAALTRKQRRTPFWKRMRAVWDWFALSATGIFYAFILGAGGIFAARILIYLFQELLGGYLQQ